MSNSSTRKSALSEGGRVVNGILYTVEIHSDGPMDHTVGTTHLSDPSQPQRPAPDLICNLLCSNNLTEKTSIVMNKL